MKIKFFDCYGKFNIFFVFETEETAGKYEKLFFKWLGCSNVCYGAYLNAWMLFHRSNVSQKTNSQFTLF